jgi:hypothetical protein
MHAQHEMDAAAQIETELQFLLDQPRRPGDPQTRGQNRQNANRERHREHER